MDRGAQQHDARGRALAHAGADGRTHDLEEHLRSVARLAREHAATFGGGEVAEVAGLWHDLGKYADDFQEYLAAASGYRAAEAHVVAEVDGPMGRRCDHSSAGAIHAGLRSEPSSLVVGLVIAAHHAGLRNQIDVAKRLRAAADRHVAALGGGPPGAIVEQNLPPLPAFVDCHTKRELRSLELFTRFSFSALCDADFLDTEAFFDAERSALRPSRVSLSSLAAPFSAAIDRLAAGALPSVVNRARTEIRRACRAAATEPPGIFTLTVPTGGGKTLAAMEFALAHAVRHGLRRVIVALPFTSILEQSADAYRDALPMDLEEVLVLEHHASLDPQRETNRSRLATENWDAPIVVTTNVQLLQSLFARRTSTCRKLHNVAGSVIVLDEAQTLPRSLLAPTTEVLGELVAIYGCTLVLCTATQPALTADQIGSAGFRRSREIISDPDALAVALRRVEVDWSLCAEACAYEALAPRAAAERDVLAVVHRRADARILAESLDRELADEATLHLSAAMCPAHRRQVLAEIKGRKGRGEPVRVVATQLVEAGVDLDFAVVYRALAGLDSLAQAAGRCNREGRLPRPGSLRVFLAPTAPPPGILAQALEVTRIMLKEGPVDLFSPATQREFFRRLYQIGSLDSADIQELRAELAFEDVASSYVIVDDEWSGPLVVPFDDRAQEAVFRVMQTGPTRGSMRELQRATITVNRRDLAEWEREGFVRKVADGAVHVLENLGAYDYRFGLVPERIGLTAPSELVV